MNLRDQLKSWLGEHFVHDFAERARMLRGVAAKGYGMDPAEFSKPFPGTNNLTTVQIAGVDTSPPPTSPAPAPTAPAPAPAPATPATGLSLLSKSAIVAALIAGSGGGALGLLSLLKPPAVPPIVAPAVQKLEDLYDLQIKRPGGDWETVPRVPKQ